MALAGINSAKDDASSEQTNRRFDELSQMLIDMQQEIAELRIQMNRSEAAEIDTVASDNEPPT